VFVFNDPSAGATAASAHVLTSSGPTLATDVDRTARLTPKIRFIHSSSV
jgi:hypothetical protein